MENRHTFPGIPGRRLVKSLRRLVSLHAWSIANRRALRDLRNAPYAQAGLIQEALRRVVERRLEPRERDWVRQIESERRRLRKLAVPLVDGSLGEGGLEDRRLTIGKVSRSSKRGAGALMLYQLVRCLNPKRVIELGTNVGMSAAYIGAALRENGQGGRLATLDASPYRQRVAQEVHRNLGLDHIDYVQGDFNDTLIDALQALGPADLVFIDGHHQFGPTLRYFSKILPRSAANAVFVFDDIRWSVGMQRAWSKLQTSKNLGLVVDLDRIGIGVRSPNPARDRIVLPRITDALN